MLGFPKSTEFNKRIPKGKFYENLSVSPALKRVFVEQIKVIYWRNKLAGTTLNIAAGKEVSEIEILEIRLSGSGLDKAALRQIDREIPYHILFLLEFEGLYQAWIGYKEASGGENAFKVSRYYHTDWTPEDKLPLSIEGLNLDDVYANFVRQIAGDRLSAKQDLQSSVERDILREKLRKEIAALEKRSRTERQPKKRFELYQQLQARKQELEKL